MAQFKGSLARLEEVFQLGFLHQGLLLTFLFADKRSTKNLSILSCTLKVKPILFLATIPPEYVNVMTV